MSHTRYRKAELPQITIENEKNMCTRIPLTGRACSQLQIFLRYNTYAHTLYPSIRTDRCRKVRRHSSHLTSRRTYHMKAQAQPLTRQYVASEVLLRALYARYGGVHRRSETGEAAYFDGCTYENALHHLRLTGSCTHLSSYAPCE